MAGGIADVTQSSVCRDLGAAHITVIYGHSVMTLND